MTESPTIKRGTATRLGLRPPPPRMLIKFPRSITEDQIEKFKAALSEAPVNGYRTVWLRDEGIDVHQIDMEELRGPRRRWWRRSR